jgi:hypothetical protein
MVLLDGRFYLGRNGYKLIKSVRISYLKGHQTSKNKHLDGNSNRIYN